MKRYIVATTARQRFLAHFPEPSKMADQNLMVFGIPVYFVDDPATLNPGPGDIIFT